MRSKEREGDDGFWFEIKGLSVCGIRFDDYKAGLIIGDLYLRMLSFRLEAEKFPGFSGKGLNAQIEPTRAHGNTIEGYKQ